MYQICDRTLVQNVLIIVLNEINEWISDGSFNKRFKASLAAAEPDLLLHNTEVLYGINNTLLFWEIY